MLCELILGTKVIIIYSCTKKDPKLVLAYARNVKTLCKLIGSS